MNKERAEQISEWVGKGAEWLASQLWLTKGRERKAIAHERDMQDQWRRCEVQLDAARALWKANENLKDVLEKNGIRPTQFRLTYEYPDCDNCYEYEEVCYDCDNMAKKTKSVWFYSYELEDGILKGIESNFKETKYDAVKIVDERTGEVVWEYKGDKGVQEHGGED